MQVQILGTESLGVRGLCCVVKTCDRNIVFDPGVALGYTRWGLLPHPAQVAVVEQVRGRICEALDTATDVVISHFHGDHMPLTDANPYQLSADVWAQLPKTIRFWTKGAANESRHSQQRRTSLMRSLGRELPDVTGRHIAPFTFSEDVPHGRLGSRQGNVMMTRVESEGAVFVHASDIQLLDEGAVTQILQWAPTLLVVSGPSLYRGLTAIQGETAWHHAVALAGRVHTCIIDHHLLRCEAGIAWVERLAQETGGNAMCAADFMRQPRRLLEARRRELYERMPVPEGWHEAYRLGLANTSAYRNAIG